MPYCVLLLHRRRKHNATLSKIFVTYLPTSSALIFGYKKERSTHKTEDSMSASSSDSWILIALTILVVLLLFYLSKKMICNSYGSSESEDSPTTSPSSSTASTSTSFSDYFNGGSNGRSPLDLIETTTGTASSSGSSPDDLAIDIADSLHFQNHHQNHHYCVDNRCSHNNYYIGNNNHQRNNLPDPGNFVTSNDRRMNSGDDEIAISSIGIGSIGNTNRGMDFRGVPPASSTLPATLTGSEQPILSPISIIAGPALDRKTILETQLRNQIAKIVQAEREIQRLVQLLSPEQRQGLDVANNYDLLVAARASLLQHHRRYPQFYHRRRGAPPPSVFPTSLTFPSETLPGTFEEASSLSDNNNNSSNARNNSATLSEGNRPSDVEVTASLVADNQDDDVDRQNSTTVASVSGNRHPHYLCHCQATRQHPHYENSPDTTSDFHTNHSSTQSSVLYRQQRRLLCGLDTSFVAGFHQHCNCNLCLIDPRVRGVMMLRRMLLPLSYVPIAISSNTATGLAAEAHEDFVTRLQNPLACDPHYRQGEEQEHHYHQSTLDPQISSPNCFRQHEHQVNDDPPPYEECVRSGRSSINCENPHQNLYSNNNDSGAGASSGNSKASSAVSVVETTANMSV